MLSREQIHSANRGVYDFISQISRDWAADFREEANCCLLKPQAFFFFPFLIPAPAVAARGRETEGCHRSNQDNAHVGVDGTEEAAAT